MDRTEKTTEVAGGRETQEILDRLGEYESLLGTSRHLAALEQKADQNRQTVRPHIFEKVKAEYAEKRATLSRDQEERENALKEHLDRFLAMRSEIEERCQHETDRLEEMDFRIRVGEFTEEELAPERTTIKGLLLEQTQALAQVEEILRKYSRAGLYHDGGADQPPSALTIEDAGEDQGADFLVEEGDDSVADEDSPVVYCSTSREEEAVPVDEEPEPVVAEPPKPSPVNGSVTGYLVALDGSRQGERFPLISSNITLGNSPGIDIRLADTGIANFHARIVYKGRKHYLENLDTLGRCFVNGIQTDMVELKAGDVLRLGETKMQVEYGSAMAAHG